MIFGNNAGSSRARESIRQNEIRHTNFQKFSGGQIPWPHLSKCGFPRFDKRGYWQIKWFAENGWTSRNCRLTFFTIMEMPNLPIDNLYKFFAISGLLLFAASIYFPFVLANKFYEEYYVCIEADSIIKADSDYTTIKLNTISNLVSNAILQQEGKYTSSVNKLELSYSNDEIKQMLNDDHDLLHQLDTGFAKIKANTIRLNDIHTEFKQLKYVTIIMMFISIILILKGFRLWYYRIQIYQDRILKNEAEKYLDKK